MRLTRRVLLATVAELGAFAAAARIVGGTSLIAQAPRATVAQGKEKLLVRSLRPPDYETPVALLDSWITPVEHFYVRSHLPVPAALDATTWALQIEG
jgi:DMSO/TMAO reductase YedYZ molybdopterin-dependent catalytic subunit